MVELREQGEAIHDLYELHIQDQCPRSLSNSFSFQKTTTKEKTQMIHIPYALLPEYSSRNVSTHKLYMDFLHNSLAADRRWRGLLGFVLVSGLMVRI